MATMDSDKVSLSSKSSQDNDDGSNSCGSGSCSEGSDASNSNQEIVRQELATLQKLASEFNGKEGKAKELQLGDIESALPALASLVKDGSRKDLQCQALGVLRSLLECRPRRAARERAALVLKDKALFASLLAYEEQLAKQTSDMVVVRVGEEALESLESLYHLLGRLALADERFGTKLRTSNSKSVLVPLQQLKKLSVVKGSGKLVSVILNYLKRICTSCTNVAALVWGSVPRSQSTTTDNGIVGPLFHILASHKYTSLTAIYAAEVLALVLRSREGILSLLEPSRGQMSTLCGFVRGALKTLQESKNVVRGLRISHALVLCLLHVAYIRPGRQALLTSDVLSLVHPLAKLLVVMAKSPDKKGQYAQRLFIMVSILMQRCMVPFKLPLDSMDHPAGPSLPDRIKELTYDHKKAQVAGPGREIYADEYFCTSDKSDLDEDDEAEVTARDCSAGRDASFSETTGEEEQVDLTSYAKFFPEQMRTSRPSVSSLVVTAAASKPLAGKKSKSRASASREQSKSKLTNYLLCTCSDKDDRSSSGSPDSSVANVPLLSSATPSPEDGALKFDEVSDSEPVIDAADWRQVYTSCSERTISLSPVVKSAEWLLHEVKLAGTVLEPLDPDCDPSLWCTKLLEHIESRMFGESHPLAVTVFDLEVEPPVRSKTALKFESRFECGNLRKAIQTGPTEYTLLLSTDLGTKGHASWFYFEVMNMSSATEYTFNLINCEKQSGLFNDGVRPLMYSVRDSELGHGGWVRVGSRAAYFRNHYVAEDSLTSIMNGKAFYTLSFTVTFPHDRDTCYLAYNYPYTYTLLGAHGHFWDILARDVRSNVLFDKQSLCTTIAGNDVPVYTLTSSLVPLKKTFHVDYVLLMAHVHPSETCASWMMKGVIDFLLSEHPDAVALRERFVFKIIPMVNPDGAIHGSTRTSLCGEDLNRQWGKPDKESHPEIYHAKNLLKFLLKSPARRLLLAVDFHGHSRRKNIFMYGCSPQLSWKKGDRTDCHGNFFANRDGHGHSELVFPIVLEDGAPAFSFDDCCFAVEKSRETTARVTLWRELGVPLSYTMEASQGACDRGAYAGHHLGIEQLVEMGAKFCSSLKGLQFEAVDDEQKKMVPVLPRHLAEQFSERMKYMADVDSSNSDDDDVEP